MQKMLGLCLPVFFASLLLLLLLLCGPVASTATDCTEARPNSAVLCKRRLPTAIATAIATDTEEVCWAWRETPEEEIEVVLALVIILGFGHKRYL